MLNLLRKQPPEAPAQHEALARLAKFKTDLENTPNTRRGDWHENVETAFKAVLATEGYIARLIELRAIDDSYFDDAINGLMDSISDIVGRAERLAEEDAPPYRHEDRWPRPVVTL